MLGLREKRVLVIMKRDELKTINMAILKPHIALATSKELANITKYRFVNKKINVIQVYPPIDLTMYKPLENKDKICGETLQRINAERIILYIGRVNESRFPLRTLRHMTLSLKKINSKVKLVIVVPPERESIDWIIKSLEIIKKANSNNVILLPRILTESEKILLYNCASAFIFPSRTVTAIEPPLTVLEAVACGTPIITTGKSSTSEIAHATNGYIYNDDLSQLQKILEIVLSSEKNNNQLITRRFAMEHLSFSTFKSKMLNIINTERSN
jgi:glycosyltransferase involved in cell wall biosynthesis